MEKLKINDVNYNIVKEINFKDVNLMYDKEILDEATYIYNTLYSYKDL